MSSPLVQAPVIAQPHLTLSEVKLSFARWRQNPNKSRRIPDELWDQVMGLLPHYPKKKVISALAIGPAQLEQRLKQQSLAPNTCLQSPTPKATPSKSFVKVITPAPTAPSHGCDIVLTRANGVTLKVEQLQHSDLIKLIEQFCEALL